MRLKMKKTENKNGLFLTGKLSDILNYLIYKKEKEVK